MQGSGLGNVHGCPCRVWTGQRVGGRWWWGWLKGGAEYSVCTDLQVLISCTIYWETWWVDGDWTAGESGRSIRMNSEHFVNGHNYQNVNEKKKSQVVPSSSIRCRNNWEKSSTGPILAVGLNTQPRYFTEHVGSVQRETTHTTLSQCLKLTA